MLRRPTDPDGHCDPRTTLLQSLEAILIAELADNACWEALIELAQEAGKDTFVQQFQEALRNEQDHLDKVQAWLAAGQDAPEMGEAMDIANIL
jgi:ferritin-like metal-binding protein YciE